MKVDASAMQRVWDMVPEIGCDGRCQDHCVTVPMTVLELAMVRGKMPWYPDLARITKEGPRRCPALTSGGRCGVYDVRPTVCRIFGAAESLPCPYGCDRPVLTTEQAQAVMEAAFEVGGETA